LHGFQKRTDFHNSELILQNLLLIFYINYLFEDRPVTLGQPVMLAV